MEENRQKAAPALLKAALAYAGRGVPVFPPAGRAPNVFSISAVERIRSLTN
jgi:hypothetical protein